MKVVGNLLKNPIMQTPSEQLQAWLHGSNGDASDVVAGPGNHHFEHHHSKKRHLDFSKGSPTGEESSGGGHTRSARAANHAHDRQTDGQWTGEELPGSIPGSIPPSQEEAVAEKKRQPMTQVEFLEKIGMLGEAARIREHEESARAMAELRAGGDGIMKVLDAELGRQVR
jgi:hypothetical protein